jgi:hypothetical protein
VPDMRLVYAHLEGDQRSGYSPLDTGRVSPYGRALMNGSSPGATNLCWAGVDRLGR